MGGEFRGPRTLEDAHAEPFSLERQITSVIPECVGKFAQLQHASAFEAFAACLEECEKVSPHLLESKDFQGPARAAFKKIWDAFIRDITERKTLSLRLDKILSDANAAREEASSRLSKPMSSADNEAWRYAVALREQQRKNIVRLSNQPPEDVWDSHVNTYREEMFDSVNFEMSCVGELYNNVLPLMRKMVEGHVRWSLIRAKSNQKNYVPVTAKGVRDNVVAFLEEAPVIAKKLAEITTQRDRSNEGWNRLASRRSINRKKR